uniref:NADH dehydrogenase subunit 2 n=1 Tax=Amblyomma argentinae TaxID=705545 RepID=UPI002E7A9223|nr:NADH dehydrogenase subunit 2 [Amblyomma argentinae]WQF68965.1 NADH dehydrogenase subunit 2 [Amblyomma argentinae]
MFFKFLMKWVILLTVIITISSKSWFIYWLMMELNLLAFIPILNLKKINNSNCMISYFIVQSFSSSLFFIAMLIYSITNFEFFAFVMTLSMMIKLAMVPFHFWLTSLSEMFNYSSLFILLTLQKFIPLFIMSMMNLKLIIIFVMISTLCSSLLMFNLKLIKKILIFSSISHQGWMISLIFMKSNFWMTYLIIYSFLIYKITFLTIKNNFNSINNLMYSKSNFFEKISFSMLIFSLGGMPPFLGFIIKFISIIIAINMNSMILIILIISSMMNIYIYINMISPLLFLNTMFFKILKKNKINIKQILMNLNLLISILLINTLMF